jgi:hypothetical protein
VGEKSPEIWLGEALKGATKTCHPLVRPRPRALSLTYFVSGVVGAFGLDLPPGLRPLIEMFRAFGMLWLGECIRIPSRLANCRVHDICSAAVGSEKSICIFAERSFKQPVWCIGGANR